jgi:hypothetical protein
VPDPDLAADMRRKADALVAAAAKSGDTLDYSLASLLVLDALLDRLFARRWPVGRAGRLDASKFGRMIEPVGAYVGETLRHEGGGEWGVHDEFGPGLELPSGTWTFPLEKARKRFEHGHQDGLAFYGEVMLGR